MKVLIIHGWAGKPFEGWKGWLGRELRGLGFEVDNPYMPDAGRPEQAAWVKEIRDSAACGQRPATQGCGSAPKADDGLILVGHSLGAVAVLRFLESLKDGEIALPAGSGPQPGVAKVRAAVLVCGFTNNLGLDAVKGFFGRPFNWDRIRKAAGAFVIINSDDDPYMGLQEGKTLHEKLGGEFIVEHKAGHINEAAGFGEYPRLLGIIRRLGAI